jgi:hypothetical protein
VDRHGDLVCHSHSKLPCLNYLTECSYCITIAAAVALYLVLWRENRNRDKMELDEVQRDKIAFDDLTDKQNPFFRYAL